MGLTDIAEPRERLKLITLEYSIESDGHFLDEPIVELFCRDKAGNRRFIEVEGFYPGFYITEEEYLDSQKDIHNESMVRSVEVHDDLLDEQARINGTTAPKERPPAETLDGRLLVKINTVKPSQVKKMREFFDEHWEADVFFTNRFLVDSGIHRGLSIPEGEDRVDYSDIKPLDEDEVPEVKPRIHTVDIEVWSGGEFPDTQKAAKPITAITAHDSYKDEYFCGVLHPDAVSQGSEHTWDDPDFEYADYPSVDAEVYHDENRLLAEYINFVEGTDPDLMTGWNSSRNEIGSGFDYPYIINRADRINEWAQDMAYENGGAFVTNRGSPVIGGREMFDMLQAYKKTQIHEKRSYSLGYIAQDELGHGKEDIGNLDEGWLHEPEQFIKYNIRDTQAVFEIEASKNVLDMYDHIRGIAGATYSEIADSNIGIIDILYLREAKKRGVALPTSVRPDTQHYWGAYVFPPEAGKHKNVVYPDLSSLYPNLFKDMNVSPETIVGFEEDLKKSKYSKKDCHKMYVDRRSESVKRSSDEPERSELYVLKPEVKKSFVSDVIDDLIQLKYKYKSDEYADEAYGAAKRITNSCFTPDTEVLTPDGRINIRELSVGDIVYSVNSESGCVEEKKITNTHKYPNYDGDIISIKNQSVDYKVTPEHNMLLSTGEKSEARNLTSHNKFYNSWSWSGEGVSIPEEVSNIFNTTEEYIRFAGWFVTEGCVSSQKSGGKEYEFVSISQHNNVDNIESLINSIECSFSDGPNYRTYNNDVVEWCKKFGQPSKNKRLPLNISKLSESQAYTLREVLLQADGNDGYYYTTSTVLSEQVAKIALKTSMNPLIHQREDGIYRVSLKCDGENYVSSQRDISVESANTGVYCVTVEDNHTLMAGRNGKFQWVGNCYGVMGDSVSYGVGFRLFDWRIAEAITLAGRDVIRHTAEEFESCVQDYGYPDAEIIAGDTDSCVCEVPSAEGMDETLDVAQTAAEYVDMTYDEFMAEQYNMDENNMAVEIESYSESALFMNKKKRYAQWVRWDEGDEVDEIEIKGFELVRSDSAEITGEVQRGVIERILREENPKSAVREYLHAEWDAVVSGDVALAELGIPSAINNELMDYGWTVQELDDGHNVDSKDTRDNDEVVKYFTPQPHIRGARYSSAYVDGEDVSQGSKPLMFYTEAVLPNDDGLPETFDYEDRYELNAPKDKTDANTREMKEVDRAVDAIAVENVRNLPERVRVDYEKMGDKTLRNPIEPIVDVMEWGFDDLTTEGAQTGLADFM